MTDITAAAKPFSDSLFLLEAFAVIGVALHLAHGRNDVIRKFMMVRGRLVHVVASLNPVNTVAQTMVEGN